jgi:penicillin-binding protein 2
MGGARAAAPVAKDVLTFLYDREKAMASLEALEAGWGGGIEERMARQYAAFQAGQGVPATERSEM